MHVTFWKIEFCLSEEVFCAEFDAVAVCTIGSEHTRGRVLITY